MRRLVLLLSLLAACRTIPLDEDPTVNAAPASPELVHSVSWFAELVKAPLLEYLPVESATPAVDPDTERVITSTRDGVIRCINSTSGQVEWELKTFGKPFAGATVADGVVYVPGGDSVLYALRLFSGEKVWSYDPQEEIVTVPTLGEGTVLVATQSEAVYAVSTETGKWRWQYRRDAPAGFSIRGVAQPVVKDDVVYAGFADGAVVALRLDDGTVLWERRLTTSGGSQFLDVDTAPVVDDAGHLFVASFKDGVFALEARSGDLLWNVGKSGVTGLALYRGLLYTAGDATVSAIDPTDGTVRWTRGLSDFSSKGKVNNSGRALSAARGLVFVPTGTALAFVDASTGRVLEVWDPGRGVSAVPTFHASVRNGPRLFVLSNLGTLFALDLASGS